MKERLDLEINNLKEMLPKGLIKKADLYFAQSVPSLDTSDTFYKRLYRDYLIKQLNLYERELFGR